MSFQIKTNRLIIRNVQKSDLPILIKQSAELEARSGILSYQADENYNRGILLGAIAEAKSPQRKNYTLSVILNTNRNLIGSCMISNVKMDSIETYIGWHYGCKYWGNGYATEAARVLLFIGFELNKVSEIYADCFCDNKASIRIMEKIGMKSHPKLNLFNTIRGLSYGESRPTVRYIISRKQWLAKIH
jgi:[ribosomal protein S5]-alanine N-acetyltransferase